MSSPFDRFDPAPTPALGPVWFDRFARWLREHQLGALGIGVIAQVVVLLAMIAIHAAPLVFGETLLFKVRPVDPRDMFRGDYVILAYDFSRAPPEGIEGLPATVHERWQGDDWLEDRTVFLSLEPDADGKHYRGGKVSIYRPKSGKYLKGKYTRSWGPGGPLRFGIEACYVQEGEGRQLEQLRNQGDLSAEVAVTPWGQATLRGVK